MTALKDWKTRPQAVGSRSIIITPAIPIGGAGAPYVNKTTIGGNLTLTNAALVVGGHTTLGGLTIRDASNQKANLLVVLMGTLPVPAPADQAAPALAGLDIQAVISIASTDWITIGSDNVAFVDCANKVGQVLKPPTSSKNLYACIILNGSTPTYANGNDLVANFSFYQDN